MILLAGLGNPGTEYTKTRHNIGFDILDEICKKHDFPIFKKKLNTSYSQKNLFGSKILLVKPMNFMNLSGLTLKKTYDFYKLKKTENLIVIHDDLDLNFPSLRIKSNGGHGGHNGVRNIIDFFGKDFYRIKIGIKNSIYTERNIPAEKFVLDKFNQSEQEVIDIIIKKIAKNLEFIVKKKNLIFLKKVFKNEF